MNYSFAKKFIWLLLIFCLGKSLSCFANTTRNLTIYSEPNLAIALTKIARLYSQNFPVNVAVNFNSSFDFINEIDSGEPADIFISAHPTWVETLKQKGLIDVYNIGYIANDQLVVVAKNNNKLINEKLSKKNLKIEQALAILDEMKVNLIIDHDGSASGFFAKEFLQNLNLENIVIFTKLQEDKNSLARDLISDDNSFALMLESQVRNNKNLQIIARKIDNNIFYRALVIAGDNMEVAREFLKFLKTSNAQKILKDNSFIIN